MVSDSDEAFRNQSLRVKEPRARKVFFRIDKFFFENLLTNSSLCGIILSVNGTNRLLGICVMAAQQTLTLYVGVRISHPQPGKKSRVSGFFFSSGGWCHELRDMVSVLLIANKDTLPK